MDLNALHPKEQIVKILQRIYDFGMTTTSGGNISILDENGDTWITPSAVDKGTLRTDDIIKVCKDGTIEGLHKPSSEYPFHKAIYQKRPDIRAIIHAHPPSLVTFSIVRQTPDTSVIAQANFICGEVGYAKYKLPGSDELGESIANTFQEGYNCVLMENHETVVGGTDLSDTFQKFETLEFCAKTILEGKKIGEVKSLTEKQLGLFTGKVNPFEAFVHTNATIKEKHLRGELCKVVKRAYQQRLIISTYGTFSARLDENDFIITPFGKDRYYLEREELVLIKDGKYEKGKNPSRSAELHQHIYKKYPEINCILTAQSPSASAYCITHSTLNTHTIPESYVLLREIPSVRFGDQFQGGAEIAKAVGKETPILLIENDSILVTGASILETFDRLEVAEFSARSLTQATILGDMVPIEEQEIEDIKTKFLS